ncbi:MAG TPA: glycosyltransferase family 2 protein [Solirubrobacterales bacterium]
MSAGPRPAPGRIRAALRRRARGPYAALDRIEARLDDLGGRISDLGGRLDDLGGRLDRLGGELDLLRTELAGTLLAIAADEPGNRRRLAEVRADEDYRLAWEEPDPLVSITVATVGRPELISRSLPSVIAQTHGNLEVIVAGDGAPAETEAAVAELGDARIRYLDLGPRQGATDDPARDWLVGATRPRNATIAAAKGRWIVEFDDDDSLRPNCVEALLALAREGTAEAVYGQVRQHGNGEPIDFCEFPPRIGHFSWAAGMYHRGLGFFGRQELAADLGLPGDWWLAERMLRAGVRFAMREEVLCDAYASGRERIARERGRVPWADSGS